MSIAFIAAGALILLIGALDAAKGSAQIAWSFRKNSEQLERLGIRSGKRWEDMAPDRRVTVVRTMRITRSVFLITCGCVLIAAGISKLG